MNQKSARAQFIFATILLDAVGLGLLIPVLPDVIRRFSSDTEFVYHWYGYFIAVYALMQFVASPVLGSLSDRFGRRPVLLISLLGAALDYLLMAFAPNLTILFIGRVISGLSGASMTVASSYMADVSDDSNRSANFGMIGAGWGIGFILGPLLGGWLGQLGPQAPFLGAAALNLLNFVWGLFILPESLPPEKRRKVDLKRLNPFASLFKVMKPSPISLMVWTFFLIFLAGQSHPSIWTLYTQHKFGWSSFDVGLSLSFVGLSIAVVQGGLTRVIIPKLGEWSSVMLGMWFYIIGFALFALATKGWMMYAVMAVSALSGITPPALQSLISKDVPSSEQGELQGSLMAMGSFTSIIAPILYTWLFSTFTSISAPVEFAGAPYFAATLICVFATGLLYVRRRAPNASGKPTTGQ